MANNLTGNPLVIDTANAGAALIPAGQPIPISAIKYIGATTAGHEAVVQDANGNPWWDDIAFSTNYASDLESFVDVPLSVRTLNGLKVPTLGSGRIYIWVG